MTLRLSRGLLRAVRDHAAREYPNECCGMLLGRVEGGAREALEAIPLTNLRAEPGGGEDILPLESPGMESERNRFLIDPREQLRVEKEARARELEVLGYYHSHPDHPARPSIYDRDHAWPWYAYVIVSVERGEAQEVTCWVLTADRSRFDPEPLEALNP
jgi:proteasome lid subunit RPN8/RPN11